MRRARLTKADGPRPADDHRVAQLGARPLQPGQRNRQGLAETALLVRHVLGHLVQPGGGMEVVARQGAVVGRCGEEDNSGACLASAAVPSCLYAATLNWGESVMSGAARLTCVVPPGPAHVAVCLAARHPSLNGHPVADLEVLDVLAHLDDLARRLVPRADLCLDHHRGANPAVFPKVDI